MLADGNVGLVERLVLLHQHLESAEVGFLSSQAAESNSVGHLCRCVSLLWDERCGHGVGDTLLVGLGEQLPAGRLELDVHRRLERQVDMSKGVIVALLLEQLLLFWAGSACSLRCSRCNDCGPLPDGLLELGCLGVDVGARVVREEGGLQLLPE